MKTAANALPAAIYARFSTDLQNERSTEDQIDLCKAFAKREGFHVVATYADKAKSGASMHGRDGLQKMLVDAIGGKFNVIIVEALDRMSRDMEDMTGIFKRLTFAGIEIIEVHGGKASTLTVGMRSMFAQMMREENVHKIRRGMTGLIGRGQTAGGKAYGYRPNPLNPGKPVIVPEEAAIVLRIFSLYADSVSPKAICKMLNEGHVTAPRGKLWAPSALLGMADRGTGMLRNPIYVGQVVWNKNRMVKDPATGRRLSRANPVEDRKYTAQPELRIIDDDLFNKVQAQLAARAQPTGTRASYKQRRPKNLLSGLLKCAACGSGMASAGKDKTGKDRLRCSAHTNSGACPNPQQFYREDVEELVIENLARQLAKPDEIYRYAELYMTQLHAEAAEGDRRRVGIEARLNKIATASARITQLLIEGIGDMRDLSDQQKALGRERDGLEAELERLPKAAVIKVNPAALKDFAERISDNSNPLRSGKARLDMSMHMIAETPRFQNLVRELISSVTLSKDDDRRTILKIEGFLGPLIQGLAPSHSGSVPVGGYGGSGGGI